jgi:hypothetical protein
MPPNAYRRSVFVSDYQSRTALAMATRTIFMPMTLLD